jgi:sn-glycerol 3-phosphate transport system substrate-binding protein
MQRSIARTIGIALFALAVSASVMAADAPKIKIQFWHSQSGLKGAATNELATRFNATIGKEKGIEVVSSYQGDDVTAKLKTLDQAKDTKNFPDVGQIYGAGIPAVLQMKPIVPVENLYARGGVTIPKADLEPNAVRAFSYQGKMVGMPLNISTILLFYNRAMFKEVGLDPDSPPRTIAEMAEAIKKLMVVKDGKVVRYGLNVNVRRYQLANWIGGQGKYNFFGDNEGGRAGMMTKVTFGEDGTLMKYLNEWEKVIATGGYKPIETNINEEFAMGLFGMAIMSTARISTIDELAKGKFEYSVAWLPRVDASDTGGTSVGGGSLCVFDKGNNDAVQAAWEFVQFCASPEQQYQYHIDTGSIPVNRKSYDLPAMKAFLLKNPAYKVAIDQLHASHPNVQEPFEIINWELDTIIRNAMTDFAQGKLTKQQTHDRIVNDSNAKLTAYVRANQ